MMNIFLLVLAQDMLPSYASEFRESGHFIWGVQHSGKARQR